jgi:preprotein translocase subunit YajC
MSFIIILLAMLVFMYFLLIRPQRAQQRRTQDMLARIAPGDEVITVGGMYGDVVEVMDDKVVLEIAEDVHIEVSRKAVAQIVPAEADEEPEEEEELEDETYEEGESADQAEEPADGPAPVREEKRWGVFGRRS